MRSYLKNLKLFIVENLTIQNILELVFTTENPETGSKPPEKVAWAIFENETVCLITPQKNLSTQANTEELANFAKKAIEELGVAHGGTASGDFGSSRVSWFPEKYVYMITYDSRYIFNVLVYEEETEDLTVGLSGRAIRSQDAENPIIKSIRDFEGNIHHL